MKDKELQREPKEEERILKTVFQINEFVSLEYSTDQLIFFFSIFFTK